MAEGIRATLADAAAWTGARLWGDDRAFAGVSTDSRGIGQGELFVALRGPNHDAHAYVENAVAGGAAAAMVDHRLDSAVPQLVVPDTRLALGALAKGWRRRLALPIVAVTGSNGKTTVKEMTAAILGRRGPVCATRGNLNNDIGVPLTLLRLESGHATAVVEMGANHPGEIAYLTALAEPDVALITNAGAAHLEGFGSVEGVARAKGEIYQGLGDDGTALVNADDPHAGLWRRLAGDRRVITFGMGAGADVRGRWEAATAGSRLTVSIGGDAFDVMLALPGRHNAMNALAAAAAAAALDIPADDITAGLGSVVPVSGRLQRRKGRNGATIIDDSYNANPDSFATAIEVLGGCEGRRYLVMGDMAELGPDAETRHEAIGRLARQAGLDALFATGHFSRAAASAFGTEGHHAADQSELQAMLAPLLSSDVTILIKGSRSAHMEQVVSALSSEESDR